MGCELKEHEQALLNLRSGLGPCDLDFINLDTCIGRVKGIEDSPVVDRLKEFDCRNNRLAQLALHQDEFEQAVEKAKIRYGPERIGLFAGGVRWFAKTWPDGLLRSDFTAAVQ